MPLAVRDKIAHLLRRFGLGATDREMAFCEPIGLDGTLSYLFDYEAVEESFAPTVWECSTDADGQIVLERNLVALWWSLRILTTARPLEQKLTLFWHNHFAVGGNKVWFVPMYHDYIEMLRKHASGRFVDLLSAVGRDPAMMRYLDTDSSAKWHPNENYAREVMELFTIGPENFSESDVREVARAFTGMTSRIHVNDGDSQYAGKRISEYVLAGKPMVSYRFAADRFDASPKTVLGHTGAFRADDVNKILADHGATARRICRKLWQFFGSAECPREAEDAMVKCFFRSEGHIKSVLRTMVECEAFWSESSVRQLVKSPLDFVVPILRQSELPAMLEAIYRRPATPIVPIPKELHNAGYLVYAELSRQGMALLDPPDVGGWKLGTGWISPGNMIQRIQLAEYVFAPGSPQIPFAERLASRIFARKILTVEQLVTEFLRIFDAPVSERTKWILMRSCSKSGGVKTLRDPQKATYMLTVMGRLLFASPEFQFA